MQVGLAALISLYTHYMDQSYGSDTVVDQCLYKMVPGKSVQARKLQESSQFWHLAKGLDISQRDGFLSLAWYP